MRKVILVDMDDTIENLVDAWCTRLNGLYFTDVQREDVTDWDVAKFFPWLTREQVFSPLEDPNFWKMVRPKEDAVVYVKKLIDDGHDVYICTSSSYRTLKEKYEYIIQRYFPYIDWQHMIIAYNKQMIKADYLIDDGVHNHIGGDYKKILMTAPHNQNYDAEANEMIRVNNWEEVYKIINN